MKNMTAVDWVAYIFVVIGAINWGLVGLTSFKGISYNWDLVSLILRGIPTLAAIIYLLVGLSGLWILYKMFTK